MQVTIDIKGLKELQATMQNLSDRRINAIAATALTRTAKQVQGKWTAQIVEIRDRWFAERAGLGTQLSPEEIEHGVNAGIISSTLLIGSRK